MIKYFAIIFMAVVFIGCKSPVTDMPTYVIPDTEDSTGQETEPPSPAPAPGPVEPPFIPPTETYIGEGGETDTSILAINEKIYVAFSDVNKNMEMQGYENNEWVAQDVSSVRVNASAKNPIDMIHIDNVPYVAFSDANATGRLRLKKLDGSSWVDAGEKYLSTETVSSISMTAIGSDLYITHKGVTGGSEGVIVRKFDTLTTTFETLPSPYSGEVKNIHITPIDGVLHITFVSPADWSNFQRVFKYVDNKWIGLGEISATGGTVIEGALNVWNSSFGEIASYNSIPYIAYVENKSLKVVSFEDDVWDNHSTVTTYSLEEIDFMVIENTLYVAYAVSYDKKLRLQKYDGTKWVDVDSSITIVSNGAVAYVDMTYEDGYLYVAFQDLSSEGAGRIKVESFEL